MLELLKISLVFVIILFLLRKKLNIGYVMLIASLLLFVLYRMNPASIAETCRKTLTGSTTIKLLLALSLIRIFEIVLRENNVLSDMMSAVKRSFKNKRAIIISMPMLIGMLPSLGGAYFSAPMVHEATAGLKMSQEEKAFINYWFRHPWEYILPLYPGLLLAAAVSNLPLHNLIKANLVYAFVLFATGFIYSMRDIVRNKDTSEKTFQEKINTADVIKKEGKSFLPVFAVLLLVMVFRIELHFALLLVTVPLIFMYKYRFRDILRITKYGFALDVITLVFGIMLFKETMETSGAVKKLSEVFITYGIPKFPILCLFPFLIGMLTGVTVGFVGSTFPILISLGGGTSLADISLAFASGFIGVLLSPVHLCLVLTREYFKADLWQMYKKMIPAGMIIFIAACVEYLILHALT